ncbi:TonB-dependent receptor [Dyadobacter sp. CY107]|uniref:SusC/RagA family TonB-linked outer membrane protein n=1 Tax=Dyadobacter fanqingshengii TaxID=2906443 RepID=UPI001F41000A|nr:TonB-dependent receptor [Dyadobacter fanqingshengii]MCF2501876.1 TonB-dependent receptor [Dyadobacter fanqingshengii]
MARAFLLFLFLLAMSLSGTAQNRQLKGVVTDAASKEPMAGVSVLIAGTTQGTTTDVAGKFSLNVPADGKSIIISYVGFIKQTIEIGNRSSLEVALEPDVKALEDVVVVGYGEQKRSHLTGAIATVKMNELDELPVGDISSALVGKLPGVSVSGGSARPGTPASIVIRNPTKASKDGGSNSPLFIIDDVIRTEADFQLLDASEIENLSILKDGAAAVYGARAALGVVVVRTKRGKAGKPQVNYTTTFGMSEATDRSKMMNGVQLATYLNDFNKTRGLAANDPEFYSPDELDHFRNNNYDWFDMAWKPSFNTRHALNISGGTDRATFFAGATYFAQNGNVDNISYKKWNFRASSDVKITKNLKVGLGVSGNLSDNKLFYLKQGGENVEKDVTNLLNTPQFIPPYVNGLPVLLPGGSNSTGFHFFEAQKLNNYTRARNVVLNINAYLEYNVPFVQGLKVRGVYNKNLGNDWGKQFGTYYKTYGFAMQGENRHIYGGTPNAPTRLNNGDRLRFNPGFSESYQMNVNLSYARDFGRHSISALALVEQSEIYSESIATFKEGIFEGGNDYLMSALGAKDIGPNTANESGILSYVGRLNYSFAERYLFEVSFRRDASTKFAPEYRWGTFPQVSAGWVLSEENLFKEKLSFINFLKLRASIGFLGGDRTANWQWLQRYTPQASNGAVFGGNSDRTVGIKLEKLPNYFGRWDDVTKKNIGLDASFLNSRLTTGFDFFHDHGYNLLTTLSSSVPLTIGSVMPSENYETINSFGFEFSTGWSSKIGKSIDYNINGFLAWNDNRNMLVDVAPTNIGTWQDPTGLSGDRGIMGYHYLGMFRSQGEVDQFLEQNNDYTIFGRAPMPGMLYYKDIRGPRQTDGSYEAPDGKITEDDMDYLTNKENNHYNFGFSFGIGYKGFKLDVVTAGSFGGQGMVDGDARKKAAVDVSRPVFWADHYTPENPNAAYPDPYYDDTYSVASSFWFRDAFVFRMRSMNLSYSIGQNISKRLGVSGLKIIGVAMNPFNFYNPYDYKGSVGAYNVYPLMKTWSLGLNLTL